ncbi:hypothetical protein JCM10213_004241 [Rhodosporidiobolus nylandii]
MQLQQPPAPYSLHQHLDFAPLFSLIQPHLIHALPLYSTLQTPGIPTPIYASFPPPRTGDGVDLTEPSSPWFVLADVGNQLRFFCSYETKEALSGDERAQAEELIVGSLRWYLRERHEGRPDIRIGAIPDIWTAAIERAFSKPFSLSSIWYQPLLSPKDSMSDRGMVVVVLPDGVAVKEAEEAHIAQILATSEVPHPPTYILTRLPHTTALFHSTSTSSASSSPELIAHSITHRDGSIGTVFVNRPFRAQGVGAAVLQERMRAMAVTPPLVGGEEAARFAYCYVSPTNEKSRALMRKIGMKCSEWGVSWAVVELPLGGTDGQA